MFQHVALAAMPNVNPENSSTGWLVGGLTIFGALLTAVGIGTGDVPRVLRNETVPACLTFSLVILASMTGASAGWLTTAPGWERRLLRFSAAMLAGAAVAAFWTGIASASERPEPAVTAQIVTSQQGDKTLHFEVKDTGLRSKERMTVLIHALTESGDQPVMPTVLYGASLGPDSSGNVDHAGEVAVPPAPANDLELQAWVGKPHHCDADEGVSGTGCTRLHISRVFEKPQLTLAWNDQTKSSAGLRVTLSANDLAQHRVVLRIEDAVSHNELLNASWPSDAAGHVSQSITAIIPPKTSHVCVVASTTEAKPPCSASPGSGNASVSTAVPPQ